MSSNQINAFKSSKPESATNLKTKSEEHFSYSGFHRKPVLERIELIADHYLLSDSEVDGLKNSFLDPETADTMIENVIGSFELPFGIGLNLMVNDIKYALPMVVEETSIVAAQSFSSKLIAKSGGFKSSVISNLTIAQIQLFDIDDFDLATSKIEAAKKEIIDLANQANPRMIRRGGGCKELSLRKVKNQVEPGRDFLILHLLVDCCEAMGANAVNSMAEAVAPKVAQTAGAKYNLRILSNLATESLVRAECEIPTENLEADLAKANEIARQIENASIFAESDPYRAATHNKGIFNGIDAVLIATGNDWRAVEAGAHAYASLSGIYKPLSTWRYKNEDGKSFLKGFIELPLSVASVGGSINVNPGSKLARKILGNPDKKTLSMIIASAGLAQNFAAVHALSTVGIQKGHMSLHARAVAMSAGVEKSYLPKVVEMMIKEASINTATAQKIYQTLKNG